MRRLSPVDPVLTLPSPGDPVLTRVISRLGVHEDGVADRVPGSHEELGRVPSTRPRGEAHGPGPPRAGQSPAHAEPRPTDLRRSASSPSARTRAPAPRGTATGRAAVNLGGAPRGTWTATKARVARQPDEPPRHPQHPDVRETEGPATHVTAGHGRFAVPPRAEDRGLESRGCDTHTLPKRHGGVSGRHWWVRSSNPAACADGGGWARRGRLGE